MRKPNSQEIICVNCNSNGGEEPSSQPAPTTPAHPLPNGTANGHIDDDEGIEAAPLPLRERIAPSTMPNHARNRAPQGPPVDSSQALADKMLEGWALLAEHCPLCSTPFVRSRDGRIYCVACDLYAVREGPGAGSRAVQQQEEATVAPPVSVGEEEITRTTLTTAAARTGSIVRHDGELDSRPILREGAGTFRENILAAQNLVAARLARRAGLLEKASSAEATTILEEIQACVQALNGLKALL